MAEKRIASAIRLGVAAMVVFFVMPFVLLAVAYYAGWSENVFALGRAMAFIAGAGLGVATLVQLALARRDSEGLLSVRARQLRVLAAGMGALPVLYAGIVVLTAVFWRS